MIFKRTKSILNKILDNYTSLFEQWKKNFFNDGSIDEITYVKDNMKIIFQEDLREHITNLFIIDTKKQIGRIYYRKIIMNKELLGIDKIKDDAYEFINKRLAPALIENDGKQTPMKGHPVFIAQHATATCCRGCLFKWHSIVPHKELTEDEIEYVVEMIFCWLQDHAGDLSNYPQTPDLF